MEYKDLKNLEDLWQFMKHNIRYGWTNKQHEFRNFEDPRKNDEYFLHSANETLEDGCGICMDQVELEKTFCEEKGIPFHTIAFQFRNADGNYMSNGHTFLVAREDDKWKYFERAFEPCNNIVEYSELIDAIVNPIYYYMLAMGLDSSLIDYMFVYYNPAYKPGMSTQDIFNVEASSPNMIDDIKDMLKAKMQEPEDNITK